MVFRCGFAAVVIVVSKPTCCGRIKSGFCFGRVTPVRICTCLDTYMLGAIIMNGVALPSSSAGSRSPTSFAGCRPHAKIEPNSQIKRITRRRSSSVLFLLCRACQRHSSVWGITSSPTNETNYEELLTGLVGNMIAPATERLLPFYRILICRLVLSFAAGRCSI